MSAVDADALLADLDADQRAAVTAPSRLVAVVAGAGSGKTRVLTRRIAHRVATGDADARHTLALTFTREAAGELRRRLVRLGLREHVEAGTFHAVMLGVLRQRRADTDRRPPTVQPDRRRLLADAARDAGLGAGRRDLAVALDEISWAMARGIAPDRYAAEARRARRRPPGGVDATAELVAAYATLKRRRGVVDFDDVLVDVLNEAERDRDFADVLRWRFRHLLVDEAQDLNPVQHRLVDLLRAGRDDLFLVGDPSQAVYGFNGADPALLVDVEERFPGVEIVRLPVNHRCTPQIVGAAAHVLAAGGRPAGVRSARDDGPAVALEVAADEAHEADLVARRVAHGDPELVRSGSVAVLARTNAQLAAFDVALREAGVAVRRTTGDARSPLRTALHEATGLTSASGLRAWAHDVLDDVGALEAASARVADLERRGVASRASARGGVDRPALRLVAPPSTDVREARAALELVEAERRVGAALLEFLREQPRADGAAFRTWVATTDPFHDRSTDGVELLTFHASKGREWHTVVVTGVEAGLVPHRSATTADERAEEARLAYVALTRATDRLVVTRAERRGGYRREPSPLLEGLDVSTPEPAAPPRELLRRRPSRGPIDELRAWRDDAARRARIVPTELLTDRDLGAIAEHRPRSAEEIDELTSVGIITARRLAPELLPLLTS